MRSLAHFFARQVSIGQTQSKDINVPSLQRLQAYLFVQNQAEASYGGTISFWGSLANLSI